MSINQESFNDKLYNLLKVRGYNPLPKDSQNKRTSPKKADVFNFTFTKNGKNYGDAWVTIDDASNTIIYYDEEQYNSPEGKTPGLDYDDSWTGFLQHLKNWAMKKQLTFELAPKDRLGDHMAKREEAKKELNEGYYPINKTSSYSDNVPTIKIVLQHTRQIQETEQRFRNIAKIFLENENGERILAPTVRPGIARVYARHLAEGGLPYDDRWKHIGSLVEEYTKMAGFVRATKNNTFTESAQKLVDAGVNHYLSLRETLSKLTSNRGYSTYFETFTPPLMEDDSEVANLNELFVQETLDPRIENVMPILTKLQKQINEVSQIKELENWADTIISEKMDSTTKSLAVPATDMLDESEERPYVCVHAKKGKFECKAKTSYEAVKKAADHWKLKSTAGIDAHLADVKHTPVNEAPGVETLAHNQSTEKSNLKAFDLDEGEIDDGEEAHKKIKTPAVLRKQKGSDWKITGQDIEKAKTRTGTTPEGLRAIKKLAGLNEGQDDYDNQQIEDDEQLTEGSISDMFGKFFGKSVDKTPSSAKQKDTKSIAWDKAKKEIDRIEQKKLIDRTGLKKVGTTTVKPTKNTSAAAQGKVGELDWIDNTKLYKEKGKMNEQGMAEGEYKSRHIHRQEQNKKYDEYRRNQEAAGKKPLSRGDWAATQRKGQQGMAEGTDYTPPKLGTVKANLMTHTQKPTVQVQVFKHNTLRGDSYWVTKEVKVFKTLDQAQAYVDRINNQGVAEGSNTVYDPITKQQVKKKSIKQQAGGPATKNGKPVEPGLSKHWSKTTGVAEDLDANQKRVGQLGPTEKAHKISPVLSKKTKQHPFQGKLVGNESIEPNGKVSEGQDELNNIKRLLGK